MSELNNPNEGLREYFGGLNQHLERLGKILDRKRTESVKVPGNSEKDILGGWDFIFELRDGCESRKNKKNFERYCSEVGCNKCPLENHTRIKPPYCSY